MKPNYWIVKTEPETFSWADLVRDGSTAWDGVRNYQARNNLKAMRVGDLALLYHSISDKALVGIARISREAYPDPTADKPDTWVCTDMVPVCPLNQPVTLAQLKENPALDELSLVRHSRLSVMPVLPKHWDLLLKMADTPHP